MDASLHEDSQSVNTKSSVYAEAYKLRCRMNLRLFLIKSSSSWKARNLQSVEPESANRHCLRQHDYTLESLV